MIERKLTTPTWNTNPSIICNSNIKTYQINDVPYASFYTWSVTGDIRIWYNNQEYTTLNTNLTSIQIKAPSSGSSNNYLKVIAKRPLVLDSDTKSTNIWVGKPDPSIEGDTVINCPAPYWFYIDESSIPFGDFQWSVGSELRISGASDMWRCRVYGVETGGSLIYCDVTNSCGTSLAYQFVYVNCGYFMMSPNPADDYLEISLDENKVDISNITEYEVKIYNIQQFLIYHTKTREPSIRIKTSKYIPGTYYVQLIHNGKIYSQQIVISH